MNPFGMKITKEAKVGIIVAVIIAVFYWGFNFLKGKDLFKNTNEYFVCYRKVGGLRESNIVSINGYQVGVVRQIRFDIKNPGQLVVCVAIDSKVNLPVGTVARIANIDLLGTVGVDLILGQSKDFVNDHDTLPGDNELTLNEQVAPLKNKLEHMLESFDSTLVKLDKTLDTKTMTDIKKSFDHLEQITRSFAEQRAKMDTILNQLVSVSGNTKISSIINNMSDVSDSLKNANITSAVKHLDQAAQQIDALLEKINASKGTAGKLVNEDSLYHQLSNTTRSIDSLVSDINRNPKKYVHFSIFGKKK